MKNTPIHLLTINRVGPSNRIMGFIVRKHGFNSEFQSFK